ncbi:hypothetical protein Z043_114574, partial [Scleropages formosus]
IALLTSASCLCRRYSSSPSPASVASSRSRVLKRSSSTSNRSLQRTSCSLLSRNSEPSLGAEGFMAVREKEESQHWSIRRTAALSDVLPTAAFNFTASAGERAHLRCSTCSKNSRSFLYCIHLVFTKPRLFCTWTQW